MSQSGQPATAPTEVEVVLGAGYLISHKASNVNWNNSIKFFGLHPSVSRHAKSYEPTLVVVIKLHTLSAIPATTVDIVSPVHKFKNEMSGPFQITHSLEDATHPLGLPLVFFPIIYNIINFCQLRATNFWIIY